MAWVGLRHHEGLVGQLAELRGQTAIMKPELRDGELIHGGSGVWCPASNLLVGTTSGGIQTPGQDISLDTPVPLIGQEILEPLRETVKFLGWELGDRRLKFFNAHGLWYTYPPKGTAPAVRGLIIDA